MDDSYEKVVNLPKDNGKDFNNSNGEVDVGTTHKRVQTLLGETKDSPSSIDGEQKAESHQCPQSHLCALVQELNQVKLSAFLPKFKDFEINLEKPISENLVLLSNCAAELKEEVEDLQAEIKELRKKKRSRELGNLSLGNGWQEQESGSLMSLNSKLSTIEREKNECERVISVLEEIINI